MERSIRFYFDFVSPYSYLAWTQLRGLGARTGYRIDPMPVGVLNIMNQVGNTPTTALCPAKRAYAGADLTRWVGKYDVPFARHPEYGSYDTAPFHRAVLAASEMDDELRDKCIDAFFAALWAHPREISTDEAVIAILADAGVQKAEEIWGAGAAQATALSKNEETAVLEGVFGVPAFVANGKLFFGNDRLQFLEEELET